MISNQPQKYILNPSLSLHNLTSAALILPGLLLSPMAQAADDDSVDFQYSHYQEGKREGVNKLIYDTDE